MNKTNFIHPILQGVSSSSEREKCSKIAGKITRFLARVGSRTANSFGWNRMELGWNPIGSELSRKAEAFRKARNVRVLYLLVLLFDRQQRNRKPTV
jgi:hypothetical protein